jgi:trehalose 6-phosphate synthase
MRQLRPRPEEEPKPVAATPRAAPERRRLVIVSNRVAVERKSGAGGLANALLDALEQRGGIWFGWSGGITADPAKAPSVRESGPVTFATLDLARADYDEYYSGFANRVLWPLFHFRTALVEYRRRDAAGYARVNRHFAERLSPLLAADDLVWVHDYHLIPLGEELRHLGQRQPLGFFLHTPFPPPELLRIVPTHRELIRQLCAYDLVGFQTDTDMHAFRDYVLREAGGRDLGGGRLAAFDRVVEAAVFPIGTDVDKLAEQAAQAAQARQTRRLCDSLRDRALIIGVDRLDYSKGLLARFEAFEELVAHHPETRGRVTFMQIAPPTRSDVPEYLQIRRSLEALAGRINGRYAEFDWTPLRYLNKSFAQRTLAGFFRVARIGLVTPLRDGMNLVAKEYVASQDPDDPGMLVLSCFAGAARELKDAVIVNPFDVEGMAEALNDALTMPLDERVARWRSMMAVLRRNDITTWRKSFVGRLAETDSR